MPIKTNKILALQNIVRELPGKTVYKFKDEAFSASPPFLVMPIEETINFKAICSGEFQEYEKYIKSANQKEHSIQNFLKLDSEIKSLDEIKISLLYSSEIKKFLITDGLHRMCICLKNKLILDRLKEKNFDLYFDKTSIDSIKNEIKKTCGGSDETGAWYNRTEFGYHSFNIGNINIRGQRTPKSRIEAFRKSYNFENKKVIDLGCNNGGMLFHLTEIKKGVGLDFDKRCIDCANKIKTIFQFTYDLEFLQKDLNKPIELKDNFDVALLLSLGSWIKNWRELYSNISKIAKTIFLETNNDKEGVDQINYMSNLGYKIKLVCGDSKDDTTGNYGRKTYLLNM
jgi:SAM-dependent methyltransferase